MNPQSEGSKPKAYTSITQAKAGCAEVGKDCARPQDSAGAVLDQQTTDSPMAPSMNEAVVTLQAAFPQDIRH